MSEVAERAESSLASTDPHAHARVAKERRRGAALPEREPSAPVPRAGDGMEPLPGTIVSFAAAESARRRMERERLPFLVVVAAGTGKLVGAVHRDSLAPGPCCERLGRRCPVVRHLAPGVDFCFAAEPAEEIAEAEADLAARGKVPAARQVPLVVVDEDLRPLGVLTGMDAPAATAPASVSRAA
jgi:hypothetical protein